MYKRCVFDLARQKKRSILLDMQTNPDPSKLSRRTFLKSSSVAVAGISLANHSFADGKTESLALSGGTKSVECTTEQLAALTRWPRYGDAEKKALCDLLDNNKYYEEL